MQGFKRANNILSAEEKKDGIEYSLDPDVKFAESDSERALFAALDAAEAPIARALEAEDFAGAVLRFASGAVGTVMASTTHYPGGPEEIVLNGSAASSSIPNVLLNM